MDDHDYIRNRLICLTRNGHDSQAEDACAALRSIKGVHDARAITDRRLSVTYSLEHLTFELIEDLLGELGFYPDDSVVAVIRRNIFQYLEDNVREKTHLDEQEKQAIESPVDPEVPHDEPEKYWNNYR
jgi:hypothetical protein